MWKIKTIKSMKLKNPILIEGLPGIGNVGKIAADYIIDQYDAKPIKSFFSYAMPNSVFVNEDNMVELPKLEIYHKKINGRDFLFLAGDAQPSSEEGSYTFSEAIIEEAQKMGCKEIVTLGGIGLPEIPSNPDVYCTGNEKTIIDRFLKNGAKKEVYGIVGPIIGVSGLLVGLSKSRKIPAAALLAETYGHPMYLGLKSAKSSLKILEKTYGFKIDYKDINEEIKLMEKEMSGEQVDEKKASGLRKLKKLKETNYIG